MTTENFLLEVFNNLDTVTVNANELQKLVIEKHSLERKNKTQNKYIKDLEVALTNRETELSELRNQIAYLNAKLSDTISQYHIDLTA